MNATHKLLFVLFIFPPLVSCTALNQPSGTLQGHVDIGPLTPVEQIGVPPPTPTAQMYAAYTIVISSINEGLPVARTLIDAQGDYAVNLPAGTYQVKVISAGFARATNLPATVTILPGATTTQDISIDTGIR